MKKVPAPIAMIDCALETQSFQCINRMIETFNLRCTYHHPPSQGPRSLERIETPSAYFVLGSYSDIHEKLAWHEPLGEFVKGEIEKGIPTLGICFGHQLVAHAFGASIGPVHESKESEDGVRYIKTKERLGKIPAGQILPMIVSHSYRITDLPECFQSYDGEQALTNDIIAHKSFPFWGTQAHPEASTHFIESTLKEPLSPEDFQNAQLGGDCFIKAFLEQFAIISSF